MVMEAPAAKLDPNAGKPVAEKYEPMLLVAATVTLVYVIGEASGFWNAKPVKVNAELPSLVRVTDFVAVRVAELKTIPPKSIVCALEARYPVAATTFPARGS